MKPTHLILFLCTAVLSVLSCKKSSVPVPVSSVSKLDSMHWLPNAKTNNSSYRFYYNAAGYVTKMIQYDRPDTNNDATGTHVGIQIDSFVYDANNRLAHAYSKFGNFNNGWGKADYNYDAQGRLVLIVNGSATQGVTGFERYSYLPDNKPYALAYYAVDSILQNMILFSYGADGNISARTDSNVLQHTARHYQFKQYDNRRNFALLLKGITYYNVLGELFPVLCTNNCTELYSVDSNDEYSTTFEYNADGYPVKNTTSLPGTLGMVTTYYYSN